MCKYVRALIQKETETSLHSTITISVENIFFEVIYVKHTTRDHLGHIFSCL